MNIGPFPWWVSKIIFCLLCYVYSQSHLVQGPLILASNALQHSWKKVCMLTFLVHIGRIISWF